MLLLIFTTQFLETMADVVKQGIIRANEDLEKENQEKLMQEVCVVFNSLHSPLTK